MAIQAPILNSILQPALYNDNSIILKIDYKLSRGTSMAAVQSYDFNFLLKTIPLNSQIDVETKIIDEKIGEYIELEIFSKKFVPGESYKIQMQFRGSEEGYWSTPAVFKVVAEPCVKLQQNDIISLNSYTGVFQASILDNSESLQYSKFILKDQFNNIIEESPKIIHNSLNDGPISKEHKLYNVNYSTIVQTESYTFISDLKNLQYYTVAWEVTTNSGLILSTEPIEIIQVEEIEPSHILKIEAVADTENGIVNGYLYHWDKINMQYDNPIGVIFGDYILLRADNKNNYSSWSEIGRMTLNSLHLDAMGSNQYSHTFFQDFSVEANVNYRYALKQYNTFYSSKKIKSNVVSVNYEYLYLFDEERQLNLPYNTKISSYKNNILETKQDTIGGKYPYIFRNGNVAYKEFTINSLLSYQADSLNLFKLNENQINKRSYTSTLTYDNINAEKIFRDEVQAWLNNGKPKYLKSSTEGLFKVYTMNITLQPNETLGRMLYTVSLTAYEIEEIDKIIVKFLDSNLSINNALIISNPFEFVENSDCYIVETYNDNVKVKNLVFSEIEEICKVVVIKSSNFGDNDYISTEFIVGPAGLKIEELEFKTIEIYPISGKQMDKTPWVSYLLDESYDLKEDTDTEFFKITDLSLSDEIQLITLDLDKIINESQMSEFIDNNNQEVKVHEILTYLAQENNVNHCDYASYSSFVQLQFIPKSVAWKELDSNNKTVESKSYVKFKESKTDKDYQILQIRHAMVLEDIQLEELIIGSNIQVNCAYYNVYYNIED